MERTSCLNAGTKLDGEGSVSADALRFPSQRGEYETVGGEFKSAVEVDRFGRPMRRADGRGGGGKAARIPSLGHVENDRQLLRVDVQRLLLIVPVPGRVRNGEPPYGKIHQVVEPGLGGGFPRGAGKVGNAVPISANVHLHPIDVEVTQPQSVVQELTWADPCVGLLHRKKGW